MINKIPQFFWLIFYPLFIIQQLWLWPTLTTNDGTTYISSALSIFSTQAFENYYWIREPVYPLFLKALLNFGDNFGVALIFIQSSFLFFSFFLGYRLSLNLFKFREGFLINLLFISVLFASGYFASYAAIVLQQALFALIFTSYFYLTSVILKTKKIKNLILLIFSYILISIFSVNLFYQFIHIQIVSSILISINIMWRVKVKLHSKFLSLVSVVLFTSMFVLIQYLSYLPWSNYKTATLSASVKSQVQETEIWNDPYFPEPVEIIEETFSRPDLPNFVGHFLTFHSLKEPEIDIQWDENSLFSRLMLQNRSNSYYFMSAGWSPYTENAEKVKPVNDFYVIYKSNFSDQRINFFLKFNDFLIKFFSLYYLLVSAIMIIVKRDTFFMQLIIIYIFSIAPYLILWPYNRYAIPFYPFMISVSLGFTLSTFQKYFNKPHPNFQRFFS